MAQLVKHWTGIAEVMGLNPVQAFFQALISQLLKLCDCITAMNNHNFISFSAVQINDISYIHLYVHVQVICEIHVQ